MIENKGFIKLYRSIIDWRWFHDGNTLKLFIYLLCRANIQDADFETITVKRGELVTSLRSLSKNTGLSIRETRTSLNHLISTQEVTQVKYPKFSLIHLNNYTLYQEVPTQISTQERHTSDTGPTQDRHKIKNNKNGRINKNGRREGGTPPLEKDVFGTFNNVFLTKTEYDQLKSEYNDYSEKIDNLSCYLESTGKSYSNHYAIIKKWAIEDKNRPKPTVSTYSKKKQDTVRSSNATYDLKAYEEYSMFDEMDD